MGNIIESVQRAIDIYPMQSMAILIFVPILALLIHNYFSLKKNQLSRQLALVLKKEKNQSMMDEMVGTANHYLGERGDKIEIKLKRANIMFKKNEYITLMLMGILGGFIAGFLIFPFGKFFMIFFAWMGDGLIQLLCARLLAGLTFAGVGYYLPELRIQWLIFKRQQLMVDQLEEALITISDGLNSGMNIREALRVTGSELKYPLGDLFEQTYDEIKAGKTLPRALEDLKDRVGLQDFSIAINAILIQNETGAPLEPLLRDMVEIISDRKVLKKEIDKAITSSKMTGIILMTAPLLFILLFSNMNSEGYEQMVQSGVGIAMVMLGAVSYVLGAGFILYILRNISKMA